MIAAGVIASIAGLSSRSSTAIVAYGIILSFLSTANIARLLLIRNLFTMCQS